MSSRFRFWRAILPACLIGSAVTAAPIISEFMADNKKTLADQDGAFSDWIEIYNPDATAVNLTGWHLTDNATNLAKWTFPAVTLDPGAFLIVFASGKDRTIPGSELHTNFSLSAGGEYLALVGPDGVTKSTEFSPTFPSQQPDVAFGYAFNGVNLVNAGAATKYRVPSSSAEDATWTAKTFTDTAWTSGTTGLGFGLLIPGITVTEVRSSSSSVTNLATTDALLAGTGASQTDVQVRQVLNFLGEGGDAHFGSNLPFAINGEAHVARGAGYVVIPAAGSYTFGINSDDGGRIRIDLNNDGDFADAGENVMVDDTLHGPGDHFGTATFAAAGSYRFEAVFFENTGGDEFEFFAAPGAKSAFDATFKLVGDTANGGLQALTLPTGASGGGAVISTNVQSAMLNVRSSLYSRISFNVAAGVTPDSLALSMRYNDGFVAWLNGTEVARRNAPASVNWQSAATATRDNVASLTPESVNLTAFRSLLTTGTNVLAIQGLNNAVADTSFLLLPELKGGTFLGTGQAYYFSTATPGTINSTPTSLGYLEDTVFSVKRGVYTAPFTLHVTCATPGSTIRYTLDGSEPSVTNGTAVNAPNGTSPADAAILVNKTTVVRAAAFKTGYTSTNIDTNTYLFFNDVIAQPASPAGWPAPGTAINGQVLDYAMDSAIVNNANAQIGGQTQTVAALQSLPCVCVSLPVASLTDATNGIYVNPGQDGFAWERAATIEMVNDPNTTNGGFHARCGLRIRGGYSRSTGNPKHGFRIFFRADYGDAKLDYPVFAGDDFAATSFDKFDLNCAQNYSWSFENNTANLFVRDQLCNDMQLAMGQPSQHNRYIHLFLNGLYWGVYGIQERPEASFAATYRGGDKEDYDVVKSEAGPYTINPTDGDLNAWQDLWNKSRACYFINKDLDPVTHAAHTYTQTEKNAAYFKMLGLAADGVTPTADPVLLDDVNLIDHMMIIFFSGNTDAPLSAFLSNNNPNNFNAMRDRRGGEGFFYVLHDSEHSFEAPSAAADRTGPFNDPVNGTWNQFATSNAQFTHQDVTPNAEYRIRFADEVYRHMIDPRGALTVAANQARLNKRGAQLEPAMIAESARWGDAKGTARTANDWRSRFSALLNSYLPARNATLLAQLKGDLLYPTIDPPLMSPSGGQISSSTQVAMSGASTTIYFTVNGPDPRAIGGGVDGAAQTYVGGNLVSVPLVQTGTDWKFRDDGVDLGTAWKESGYSDAAWTKHGPSRLGFGEAISGITDATAVSFVDTDPGTSGTQKNITTYFRTSFNVVNPATFVSVTLEVARDDGCVVYLNGKELGRSNMPPTGTIASTTLASSNVNTATLATTWYSIPVAIADFVAGTNVLAVEVHQNANNSPDLGFDCRLITQQIAPGTPISMTPGLNTVRARILDNTGTWSALNEQVFLVDTVAAAPANLAVSEIMFNPDGPSAAEIAAGYLSDQDFQWLEIRNFGSQIVDLRGAYFFDGIGFTFPQSGTGSSIAPGQRLILVENLAAFQFRYGHSLDALIAGKFSGALDKGGEHLLLKSATGTVLIDFTYDDAAPWPTAADGDGYSLTYSPPAQSPPGAGSPANDPTNWRSSAILGGTPGGIEPGGPYATWKSAHSITADAGDGDADGVTNFYEYAVATDPAQPNAVTLVSAQYVPDAALAMHLAVQFRRNLAADDVVWTVETSSTLVGPWQTDTGAIVDEHNNGDGTATMTWQQTAPVSSAGDRQFVRARASLR